MNLNLIRYCRHILDNRGGKLQWLKLFHQALALDTATVSFQGGPQGLPFLLLTLWAVPSLTGCC